MKLTAKKLAPAFKYLSEFFAAHHREHRIMMHDAGGAIHGRGREPYEGHNEAIDCIRDAILFAEESFSELSIPKGFISPKKFIDTATVYRDMLDRHVTRILALNKANDDVWHSELAAAYEICAKSRDAMEHAIELTDNQVSIPPLKQLVTILSRLPQVSRSISKTKRHAGRETLEVSDEYDVQDLLYGVLHIAFDDIRPEVWCPDYAGTSTRTDFFLASAGIVIEVKHTKKGKAQTKVVQELIIDIARYKLYPGANHLVCFIWDTEHNLRNATALKADLEKNNAGFVTVVVAS